MSEINFLQGSAWAGFQRSMGNEVLTKHGQGWSYLAIVEHGKLSGRLYCPLGPIADSKESLTLAVKDLTKEAKNRGLLFVRIEPTLPSLTADDLTKMGCKKAYRDVQPPHTVVNDVSVSEEDILANLSQKVRRYNNKCNKAGIKYRVSYNSDDIKYFIDLIHEVAKRTGMKPHNDAYFKQIATSLFPKKAAGLLLSELDGKVIAAVIFYTDNQTMSYAHAANSTEYRQLSPATGLGVYALKFAHQQGCKLFDWFGVAPADDDGNPRWKAWSGFTQFKLSYHGERIDRLGAYELPVKKLSYTVYRLLLAITRR